jgi:hypothetical protein
VIEGLSIRISAFDFMFLAGLHSELTTQGQVTPKRIKMENKSRHATVHKLSNFFS